MAFPPNPPPRLLAPTLPVWPSLPLPVWPPLPRPLPPPPELPLPPEFSPPLPPLLDEWPPPPPPDEELWLLVPSPAKSKRMVSGYKIAIMLVVCPFARGFFGCAFACVISRLMVRSLLSYGRAGERKRTVEHIYGHLGTNASVLVKLVSSSFPQTNSSACSVVLLTAEGN